MSDSDSDCGELVRMSSTKSLPSEWETVPESKDFQFKGRLHGPTEKKSKIVYTLKKGLELPYSTKFFGTYFSPWPESIAFNINIFLDLKVTFSKALEPKIDGLVMKKDGDFWTFPVEGNNDGKSDANILA